MLLAAIDALQSETAVKIPNTMAIELLEATRSGKVTYETLCEYMDRQTSKAVLGQTATTEGTPGKLGNENAQEEVRGDILKADADLVCECLNQTLVRWIVDFNFSNVTAYPALWIRTEAEKDLKDLAERDKIIIKDMGMEDRVPESYITETYGIPLAEKGEAVIGKSKPSEEKPPKFSEMDRFTPDQQAVEDLIADVMPAAEKARDAITGDILSACEQAESFEELEALLSAMLKDNVAAKDLETLLARAMAAGNLWGRYAAS